MTIKSWKIMVAGTNGKPAIFIDGLSDREVWETLEACREAFPDDEFWAEQNHK